MVIIAATIFSVCLLWGFLTNNITSKSDMVNRVAIAAMCMLAMAAVVSGDTPLTMDVSFVGSGFHQQLQFGFDRLPAGEQTIDISLNLTKAFFVDIAEALQVYDAAVGMSIVTLASQYVFDIEAPIFRVPYSHNLVKLVAHFKGGSSATERLTLRIPIHTRYDVVNSERPFSVEDMLGPIDTYRTHCIAPLQDIVATVHTGDKPDGTLEIAVTDEAACVRFPLGVLSHLPVVYWATMAMLCLGALSVILLLR